MYEIEDQIEILRLAKVAVAKPGDCDSIYHLLKKYIKPNAPMYSTSCSCKSSIGSYYQQLLDWYSKNANEFIPIEEQYVKRTDLKESLIWDPETNDFIPSGKRYTSEGRLIKPGMTLDG